MSISGFPIATQADILRGDIAFLYMHVERGEWRLATDRARTLSDHLATVIETLEALTPTRERNP